MSLIVDETNRYAEQVLHGTNKVCEGDAVIVSFEGTMCIKKKSGNLKSD